MSPRRLFFASCVSLIASAFSFVLRQDVLPAWGETFDLNATQLGAVAGSAFLGMAVSMAIGSFVVDLLGMKKMLGLAFFCHLVGTLLTITAPYLAPKGAPAYYLLYAATFLVGSGNGLVEIGINPLAATLFPTEKTHKLNVLHSWWPGGMIVAGLISVGISSVLGLDVEGHGLDRAATMFGWQIKTALILIPMLVYGGLFLFESFPVTERVAAGVSNREMLAQAVRPMFLLWAFSMLLTASTELSPQSMQSLVLGKTACMKGTYILIYTSTIMFVLRQFAGPLAHKFSPVGMLLGSSVLSMIGLFSLSFAYDFTTAIAAATIYGFGISYFWPTMLGVTAERFPRGGAFLLGVMGCVGNLAIGVVSPAMGNINDRITYAAMPAEISAKVVVSNVLENDRVKQLPKADQDVVLEAQKEGAKWSFRYVSALPLILIAIFGAIVVSDKARGGYKPEEISSSKIAEASVASDF